MISRTSLKYVFIGLNVMSYVYAMEPCKTVSEKFETSHSVKTVRQRRRNQENYRKENAEKAFNKQTFYNKNENQLCLAYISLFGNVTFLSALAGLNYFVRNM